MSLRHSISRFVALPSAAVIIGGLALAGAVPAAATGGQSGGLALTNYASPSPATSGQPLTYNIEVTNNGTVTLNVTVTAPLPTNTHFVSVSADNGTCTRTPSSANKTTDGTVTCGSILAPAKTIEINVVVIPTKPGALSNTASATDQMGDTASATNTITVQGH